MSQRCSSKCHDVTVNLCDTSATPVFAMADISLAGFQYLPVLSVFLINPLPKHKPGPSQTTRPPQNMQNMQNSLNLIRGSIKFMSDRSLPQKVTEEQDLLLPTLQLKKMCGLYRVQCHSFTTSSACYRLRLVHQQSTYYHSATLLVEFIFLECYHLHSAHARARARALALALALSLSLSLSPSPGV